MINNQYCKALWLAMGLLGGCSFDLDLDCLPGEIDLQKAAGTGKHDVVIGILGKSTNSLNACCAEHPYTPLMEAAINNDAKMIKILLEEATLDPNKRNFEGDTALICAARKGKKAAIEALLENEDININMRNHTGDTALAATFEFTIKSQLSASTITGIAVNGEDIRALLSENDAKLCLDDSKTKTICHEFFSKNNLSRMNSKEDLTLAKQMIKLMTKEDRAIILAHIQPKKTTLGNVTNLFRNSKKKNQKLNSGDTGDTSKTSRSKPPKSKRFGKYRQQSTGLRKKSTPSRKRAGSAGGIFTTLTQSRRKRNVSNADSSLTLSRKKPKGKASVSIRKQIIELLKQ